MLAWLIFSQPNKTKCRHSTAAIRCYTLLIKGDLIINWFVNDYYRTYTHISVIISIKKNIYICGTSSNYYCFFTNSTCFCTIVVWCINLLGMIFILGWSICNANDKTKMMLLKNANTNLCKKCETLSKHKLWSLHMNMHRVANVVDVFSLWNLTQNCIPDIDFGWWALGKLIGHKHQTPISIDVNIVGILD